MSPQPFASGVRYIVGGAPAKIAPSKTLSFFPSFGASPRNVTAVRLLQPKKVLFQIRVTPSPIVMLVWLLQLAKAKIPMLVTLSPIVMLVSALQREKINKARNLMDLG